MPLRSKVKRRIRWLLSLCLAIVVTSSSVAGEAGPNVGQRAVSSPKPPALVPPVLGKAATKNLAIKVNLKTQRLQLLVDGVMAIDSPVSTGRRDLETPAGQFQIGKKEASPKPDTYGNLIDANGKIVIAGVFKTLDPVPRGLRFQPIARDHLMAIKDQKFSLHGGKTCALPVSDGAIIVPPEVAKLLFSKVSTGCPIEIVAE